MAHANVDSLSIRSLNSANFVRHSVVACWLQFNNFTINLRIGHDLMGLEKGVLIDNTKDVTATNGSSGSEVLAWLEGPHLLLVQAWQLDTSWDENTLCDISDFFQWSLNSIENCLQNTWSEFD